MSRVVRTWMARALIAAVFAMNVQSAIALIVWPSGFAPRFELSGAAGSSLIQAIGILFLMWNATYPPVIVDPGRFRVLFGVVIAQQVIGLAGESWLLAGLSPSHTILASSAARFIFFDSIGLIALVGAFLISRERAQR